MNDIDLRKSLLRLAHEKPELREQLVPLLTKEGGSYDPEVRDARNYIDSVANTIDVIAQELLAFQEDLGPALSDIMDRPTKKATNTLMGVSRELRGTKGDMSRVGTDKSAVVSKGLWGRVDAVINRASFEVYEEGLSRAVSEIDSSYGAPRKGDGATVYRRIMGWTENGDTISKGTLPPASDPFWSKLATAWYLDNKAYDYPTYRSGGRMAGKEAVVNKGLWARVDAVINRSTFKANKPELQRAVWNTAESYSAPRKGDGATVYRRLMEWAENGNTFMISGDPPPATDPFWSKLATAWYLDNKAKNSDRSPSLNW